MKITKSKLREIINEELDAILDEAKEDDWPESEDLDKGAFTAWCEENDFPDGPGIGCAKAAMDSDSPKTRGMATFYMNTVKPGGHDASHVAQEGCPDRDKEVIEHVGTVSEPPPHARRVATPMKAEPVGVQGDLFLHSLLGQIASEPEFANAGERAIAAELYRRAMDQAAHLEEDTMVVDDTAANSGVWLATEKGMYAEGALEETGMSGYEGPELPPKAMEELVRAVLHALRGMGFMKKEVPPEEESA